jgi:hypothetical protein
LKVGLCTRAADAPAARLRMCHHEAAPFGRGTCVFLFVAPASCQLFWGSTSESLPSCFLTLSSRARLLREGSAFRSLGRPTRRSPELLDISGTSFESLPVIRTHVPNIFHFYSNDTYSKHMLTCLYNYGNIAYEHHAKARQPRFSISSFQRELLRRTPNQSSAERGQQ